MKIRLAFASAVVVASLLAACGGGDGTSNASAPSALDAVGAGTKASRLDADANTDSVDAGGPLVGLADRCLDVPNNDQSSGMRLRLWDCNGSDAQRFTLTSAGDLKTTSGMCVDVWFASPSNGAEVKLYDCHGGSNQKWRWDGKLLRSELSGRCLDVAGANPNNDASIIMWDCHGGANQQWSHGPSRPIGTATWAAELDTPWGFVFLPDGRALVTLKGGSLVLVAAGGGSVGQPLGGVPAVVSSGQGGLLDVAIDPDFATDPWVYISYAEAGTGADAGNAGTAVARGRLFGNALVDVHVIFRQLPKVPGTIHFGSRLVFGTDKTLFVTLGERLLGSPSQDVTGHLGKVVRIARDGSVPPDNPSFGADSRPELWSIGLRNPQGAALHPTTGELWVAEHGPQGGDEINIARAGSNYGWPMKSYGCNYGDPVGDACRIGGGVHAPTYVEPLTTWTPTSIAPSGLAFYTGDLMPEWRGNLFMGSLAGRALWRLVLDNDTVTAREALFTSLGERIRDVRQGPDGALYVLTDSEAGRIVRIGR
ncbi:MAG TPA: lectin [Caldimonas sp.]|nr:lectin [Caldimonas sp.]HEX2541451.1 lectin [Caldimonas sp.]